MAYETWMEYNDKIISLGLFTCTQCRSVLVPPVILSQKYGNICSPCFQIISQTEEIGNCLENHSLSTLLHDLYFPCRYKDQNCSEKLKFTELKSHEDECIYRTTLCIFSPSCDWVGRRIHFIRHILEVHKDKTLHNENDKFNIEITIQEDNDSMYILQTASGLFVIRIKFSQAQKKLFYKIYDYDDKRSKYEFRLKIESRQSLVCYKTTLKVSHLLETLSVFTEEEATKVDLVLLEEALKTEESVPLKSIIKVICKDENIIVESSMLNHMKCMECNKLLRPPIYQCFSGHSICSTCKKQMAKCSSCAEGFGNTRNYSLESLADQIRYPCQFESNGCRVKTPLASNHEVVCDYQMYSCFMKKCNYKGTHIELMDHLRQEHRSCCYEFMETVYFRKPLNRQQESTVTRMCLINYNTIFKMTNGQDATHTHWGVNMISTYNDKSAFVYELAVYDIKEPDKKYIRKGILTHKQVHIFSINKDDLKEFLDGDMLSYYFRVIKKS